ncbi:MAG: hypothetical protein IKM07_07215 [Clostridia bacterium]|nr:hypothetical protein [Clostridia bacterium]
MKLLPTPQSYVHSEALRALKGFSVITCSLPCDDTVRWGLAQLEKICPAGIADGETLTISLSDDAFFTEKNAREQGYILRRDNSGVMLFAQTSVGVLYGLMTLCQLLGDAPDTFEIKDRPQIRFRGNMNTLWAESGVWSYDFGDGLDAAIARLHTAIDDAARAKLNLMYFDAFGFRSERFPGYNDAIHALSEYARVRGVYLMSGGYGMGYGQAAHGSNVFMGKVYRNRWPYPDGELYDCIGTYEPFMKTPEEAKGRSYGTCLSNTALTDDKIEELREYLRNTGTRILYMHNMDADRLYTDLWLARCVHCREKYPSDSLFDRDGAAGAFADFYDRMLSALLPEFPDLIICPVSPGYCYAESTSDEVFETCRRFWGKVMEYAAHSDALIPTFRELFLQHDSSALRYDLLEEVMPAHGSVYFSSGDGFYSDKIYTPSAAYAATMHHADLIICANGGALQKPTQYANAEYLWNPDHSAFWEPSFPDTYAEMIAHYNAFREGKIRPEGIYGKDGLLETSCALLFGEKYAARIADIFRIRGKNDECPIFTACNVEIWTRRTYVNYPMLWDKPEKPENVQLFRERFAESTIATYTAMEMLAALLEETDLPEDTRSHLSFLHTCCRMNTKLCSLLTRYMDLYIEADAALTGGAPCRDDIFARARGLIHDADRVLEAIRADDYKPFDPLGGVLIRRDAVADLVSYGTSQIIQSLETGERIPPVRRDPVVRNWW